MVAFLLTCATTWLSLIAVWFVLNATHRGQQEVSALTLSHVRYGLSALLMSVLCTFRRPSMCLQVHHELPRNAWRDLTTIIPIRPYHKRSYVEPCSRFRRRDTVDQRATLWRLLGNASRGERGRTATAIHRHADERRT